MTKSMRHENKIAALCLLVLAGCNSTSSGTKRDAATDARDGSTDRTTPDAQPATDLLGDGTRDLAISDSLPVGPEMGDQPPASQDAAPDGTISPAIDAILDVAPGEPDAAIEAAALGDLPPSNQGDAAADAPDAGQDAAADRPATSVDAPAADTSPKDANARNFTITVVPNRVLDLVFMLDNSPSMAPKQAKLKAQFPKLIDALKDPNDGTLPDLRLALIDSDLGTGSAYTSGSCGPKVGVDGGAAGFGDLGKFQMIGAAGCGVTGPSAQWLEYQRGQPVNYTGDIDSVFTCLAGNLGTLGCGEEHPLQAYEFALVASGLGNEGQRAMLRPNAYLGLVFLTDEEDCSAAPNDAMFGDKPELRGESASLRCSTRSHACGGVNLTTEPPGYPTTQSFSALLSTCAARTDDCPNSIDGTAGTDTSVPTSCSPLRSIKRIADEVKALKARPDEQIFVAGIFGWPLDDVDLASATYRIAPIPNPNTADTTHPMVFDMWPICYDPNHPPASIDGGTGFDSTAAGWGATPGLRLSSFVDEFGDNGMKFSICQPDFSVAMSKIGAALARKSPYLCVAPRSDQYANCTAHYLVPDSTGALVADPTAMPLCNGSQSNRPCFRLVSDATKCEGGKLNLQLLQSADSGVDGGGALPSGTMLEFSCS
jgi:hypothetical protein